MIETKPKYNLGPEVLDFATEEQKKCEHVHTDGDAYFGETCLDCGLYLNNGA